MWFSRYNCALKLWGTKVWRFQNLKRTFGESEVHVFRNWEVNHAALKLVDINFELDSYMIFGGTLEKMYVLCWEPSKYVGIDWGKPSTPWVETIFHPSRKILDNFEEKLGRKIGLEGLWQHFPQGKWIFSLQTRPFCGVLGWFWGCFLKHFHSCCVYKLGIGFLYNCWMIFKGFWCFLDKQKWAKSMEGYGP